MLIQSCYPLVSILAIIAIFKTLKTGTLSSIKAILLVYIVLIVAIRLIKFLNFGSLPNRYVLELSVIFSIFAGEGLLLAGEYIGLLFKNWSKKPNMPGKTVFISVLVVFLLVFRSEIVWNSGKKYFIELPKVIQTTKGAGARIILTNLKDSRVGYYGDAAIYYLNSESFRITAGNNEMRTWTAQYRLNIFDKDDNLSINELVGRGYTDLYVLLYGSTVSRTMPETRKRHFLFDFKLIKTLPCGRNKSMMIYQYTANKKHKNGNQ